VHRAQYFKEDSSGKTFLENAIRFGASFQESENSSQASLFGEYQVGNILAAQQDAYKQEYKNLFGKTNGVSNAANTVNSLIGAGKSIAGLFS
jgi:hypothetical protein